MSMNVADAVRRSIIPDYLLELVELQPPEIQALIKKMPQYLVNAAVAGPAYVDRRMAAGYITREVVEISPRSLEIWNVPKQLINGRAVSLLIVYLAVAFAKLSDAPMTMGGRRGDAIAWARGRPTPLAGDINQAA